MESMMSKQNAANPCDEETEAAQALRNIIVAANRHFLELPNEEFVEFIRSNSYRTVLGAIAELADGESQAGGLTAWAKLADGALLMDGFLAQHEKDNAAELSHLLGVDRTRLYRGVTPSYSPPYPAEAVWRGRDDRRAAVVFEELVVLYRANGLQLATSASERPDYIGVQLDFAARMIERRISALQQGNRTEADACAQAVSAFAAHHLDWFSSLVADERANPETDFYKGHLLITEAICTLLAS